MAFKSVACICAILIVVTAYADEEAHFKARFRRIKSICQQAATIDEMLEICAENIYMPDHCIKCGSTYINLENMCTLFRSANRINDPPPFKEIFKEKPTRHAFRSCRNYRPKEIDREEGKGNGKLLNQMIAKMK